MRSRERKSVLLVGCTREALWSGVPGSRSEPRLEGPVVLCPSRSSSPEVNGYCQVPTNTGLTAALLLGTFQGRQRPNHRVSRDPALRRQTDRGRTPASMLCNLEQVSQLLWASGSLLFPCISRSSVRGSVFLPLIHLTQPPSALALPPSQTPWSPINFERLSVWIAAWPSPGAQRAV